MSDWQDLAVRWTVRLALAFYLAALVIRLNAASRPRRTALARIAWTAGYVAFLLHLAAAFHFVHGWSHDDTYDATARDSLATVGLAWGGGVFANYAFAIVWGVDALWWWLRSSSYVNRPRWIEWPIQGFLGFIAFNATAVFGHGAIRWFGWAALVILAISAFRRARPV